MDGALSHGMEGQQLLPCWYVRLTAGLPGKFQDSLRQASQVMDATQAMSHRESTISMITFK